MRLLKEDRIDMRADDVRAVTAMEDDDRAVVLAAVLAAADAVALEVDGKQLFFFYRIIFHAF